MSSIRYTTPATLEAMKGKWGFAYDEKCCCSLSELLDVCIVNLQNGDILIYNDVEECWENGPVPPGPPICMEDLCDVCYDPPATDPTDGQFLVYVGPPDDCWQNKDVEVCEDVVTGAFENLRAAEIYEVLPGPILVIVSVYTQYPAAMPITNAVHNIWLNSAHEAPNTGLNFSNDLSYYNGNLAQACYGPNHFWYGYNGGYTPILPAPGVSTPHITIPEGVCGRVAIHNMSYAKLFSDKVDNGSLGVFFKITNIADPTDEYHFMTRSQRTVADGYNTGSPNPPPLDWWQPYAWEITEVGSHSYGDNTVEMLPNPIVPGDRTYRLMVFYYTSPRYIDHTVNPVQSGNVLNAFEIEPFFYLTFEKDNINIT